MTRIMIAFLYFCDYFARTILSFMLSRWYASLMIGLLWCSHLDLVSSVYWSFQMGASTLIALSFFSWSNRTRWQTRSSFLQCHSSAYCDDIMDKILL